MRCSTRPSSKRVTPRFTRSPRTIGTRTVSRRLYWPTGETGSEANSAANGLIRRLLGRRPLRLSHLRLSPTLLPPPMYQTLTYRPLMYDHPPLLNPPPAAGGRHLPAARAHQTAP